MNLLKLLSGVAVKALDAAKSGHKTPTILSREDFVKPDVGTAQITGNYWVMLKRRGKKTYTKLVPYYKAGRMIETGRYTYA